MVGTNSFFEPSYTPGQLLSLLHCPEVEKRESSGRLPYSILWLQSYDTT